MANVRSQILFYAKKFLPEYEKENVIQKICE